MKKLLAPMIALSLLAAANGCRSDDAAARPDETPTTPTTAPDTTAPVEETPTPSNELPETSPELSMTQWELDTDGDAIPDFIEVTIADPDTGHSCFVGACAEGEAVGLVEFAGSVNTIILLDASGSMAGEAGPNRTKMDLALESVNQFYKTVPMNEVFQIGLIALGHQGTTPEMATAENCEAIETIEPLARRDEKALDKRLDKLEPTGWTPLADAIEKAGEMFPTSPYSFNRLVIISDGIERCGGDPVQVARQLADKGVIQRIDVVGFEAPDVDTSGLRNLTQVTKGDYFAASDTQMFFKGMDEVGQTLVKTQDAWLCGLRKSDELAACYQRAHDFAILRATDALGKMPAQSAEAEIVQKVVDDMTEGRQEINRTLQEFSQRIDEFEGELGEQAQGERKPGELGSR